MNEDGPETEMEGDAEALEVEHRPWDPSSIRISTKNWSLKQVVDEINDGTIDLSPAFQRDYVWKERQKSLLIESLALGIPLPVFYFDQDEQGGIQVVDGVQRLTTIRDYFGDNFVPTTSEYQNSLMGRKFSQLEAMWKRRLNQTQIVVHVIDPQTPADLKFDIFRRINTGGTPLSTQEIRHCMVKARARDYLARLTETKAFKEAIGGALKNNKRMVDRELALRFLAFRDEQALDDYDEARSFDGFLLETMKRLDDPIAFSDARLDTLAADFEQGLNNARAVFGKHAFRRWAAGEERTNPLNKALFESWTVALAEHEQQDVAQRAELIRDAARARMKSDDELHIATSVSTGDRRRVRYRFEVARRLAATEGGASVASEESP